MHLAIFLTRLGDMPKVVWKYDVSVSHCNFSWQTPTPDPTAPPRKEKARHTTERCIVGNSRRDFLGQSAGLVAALALPEIGRAATAGGTLTVGSQNMRTLNPAIQPGNATGLPGTQLFAGLVLLDDKFQPQPYLAQRWEVSQDGLEYRFHLVENAVFHDGRPVTANDVAFSVQTVKAAHPFMSVVYGAVLDTAKALDTRTVAIRLKKPFGGLFGALTPALTPILPEHVYGSGGPIQSHPANAKPVGSGPYKLVGWKPNESLVLERHAQYFRQAPYYDRLAFKLSEDTLAHAISIERGTLDFLPFSFLRVNDLQRMMGNPDLVVTRKGYEALGPVIYLDINMREAPLSDLRVRQAIAHAIDKDFITKALHRGMSRRLDGPLHSGSPYFDAAALTRYDYDLKQANQLLDAAGLPRKEGDIRVQLTLDVPTFEPDSTQLVADYLKTQLRKIGLDIVLRRSTDLADWASRVGQWNYQLTMNSTWNWSDPVIGVNRNFLSTNIKKQIWTNTEGYVNPKVDELLNQAATEADQGKRKALYSEFQKLVTADLPFVWTNEGIYITVYRKTLRDVPSGVFGALAPLDTIRPA